jgi:hypothetical protein
VGAGPGLAPAGHLLPRDELAAALLDGLLALELVDDAVQGGRVDAERDLLQPAVLGDGGLELLEAPDDTLLEVSADPRPAADARAPGVRRRRGPG